MCWGTQSWITECLTLALFWTYWPTNTCRGSSGGSRALTEIQERAIKSLPILSCVQKSNVIKSGCLYHFLGKLHFFYLLIYYSRLTPIWGLTCLPRLHGRTAFLSIATFILKVQQAAPSIALSLSGQENLKSNLMPFWGFGGGTPMGWKGPRKKDPNL